MSLAESDRQYYKKISKAFDHDGGIADKDEQFASVNVVEQFVVTKMEVLPWKG